MDCWTKEDKDYGLLKQRGLRLWIVEPKMLKIMDWLTKDD